MTSRLALLLASCSLMLGYGSVAHADSGRLSVIELFTSQGCSSCPPADALIKTYAKRPDVIALSLSVDYWDYLGWKDTLASPKFTERQRAYAAKRGDGAVYTPQIVVDGLLHVIGSHAADIDRAIATGRANLTGQFVEVRASASNRMLSIELGARPAGSKVDMATVWLAVVQPEVEVEIKQGENRGRKVTYVNVVRDLSPVGAWMGTASRIELPEQAMLRPGERCAILLQAGEGGSILGAAWVRP